MVVAVTVQWVPIGGEDRSQVSIPMENFTHGEHLARYPSHGLGDRVQT